MSSFLHSAKHFNSIENSLIELKKNNSRTSFCYNVSVIEIQQVMQCYRNFSCVCVTNQYKHHFENVFQELLNAKKILENERFVILKPIDLYKAIQSMEYQIEFPHLGREFTDTENIAILKFKQIKFELANLIIQDLQEYEDSRCWSI
jgi:hypothetical protein